ncbi:amidohydrolase family protein [Paenibacillus solisilvae]|uniref:Amidohydrolase family protein n=1 Tax=Paenibacillus solisilvae TaxID=2486751 RepID=A0ABW0W2F8_9BACL
MKWLDAHVTVGDGVHFKLDPGRLLDAMDRHEVETAVLSPPDHEVAFHNEEGNESMLKLIRAYPGRFAAYAVYSPWRSLKGTAPLEKALEGGCRGIKLDVMVQGCSLLDPIVDPLIDAARRHRAFVYVRTGASMHALPLQAAELARRHPDVSFILGRMGKTDYAVEAIPALLQVDNLYAETVHNYVPYLKTLIAKIGVGRILFSSDLPLTSYERETEKIKDLQLPDELLEPIVHGNLLRLLSPDKEGLYDR